MPTLDVNQPVAADAPTLDPPTLTAMPPARPAAAPPTPAAAHPPHGKPLLRLVLEVALIAVGVFLGLMGEQWRERAEHRELAQASLRRFRDEFRLNRKAVADVRDQHVGGLRDIQTWLRADAAARAKLGFPFRTTAPAFLEYTAWDLALATQSLGYIDAALAQDISRVYAIQRQLDNVTRTATDVMYMKAGGREQELPSFLVSMALYFGDCNLIEPRLLALYDRLLPRLDRALGGRPADGGH
jgi:hypothetical protein